MYVKEFPDDNKKEIERKLFNSFINTPLNEVFL